MPEYDLVIRGGTLVDGRLSVRLARSDLPDHRRMRVWLRPNQT